MGSHIIWLAVHAITQEIFLISSLSFSTPSRWLLDESKALCFPPWHNPSSGHRHLPPGWLQQPFIWSLVSPHLGNYFCAVASEIFLNCKFEYVTPLLLTLQKPPIAPVKGVGMIQKAFHDLSLFIVCSLGFPTSISTFFPGSLHWWDLIQNLVLQTSYKLSKQVQRSLNRTGLESGGQITNLYRGASMSKEVLKEMQRWVIQGSAPWASQSIEEWTRGMFQMNHSTT